MQKRNMAQQGHDEEEILVENKVKSREVEDEELDSLLDDALKDFSNENIANVGKSEKTGSSNAKSTSKSKERQGPLNYSHQNMEELFSEEGFAKMAEEFSKAFQSMPADDLDIFKGFNESSLQDSKAGGASAEQSLEENLEKAWESMTRNLKEAKEEKPDDFLGSDFLDAMKGLGLDNSDANPENFISMMQGMMTNLLSKDILYPSLKEIQIKYPSWLEEHRSSLSDDDYGRFTRQQELVSRICIEFESEAVDDSEETKKLRVDKIMELMQKMQACGQPPMDLLGQMDDDAALDSGQPRPNIPGADQCNIM